MGREWKTGGNFARFSLFILIKDTAMSHTPGSSVRRMNLGVRASKSNRRRTVMLSYRSGSCSTKLHEATERAGSPAEKTDAE